MLCCSIGVSLICANKEIYYYKKFIIIINGDYNIDLLRLQNNAHYNTFYESVTAHGFFLKITRPTHYFENSHSLIDNTFN